MQPLLRGLFTRKKEEKDVSKTVVRLWTNFAKSSDPTPNPGMLGQIPLGFKFQRRL